MEHTKSGRPADQRAATAEAHFVAKKLGMKATPDSIKAAYGGASLVAKVLQGDKKKC